MRHLGQRHDDAATDGVPGLQAGQRAQLEQGGAGVDQGLQALAHHHLAAGPMALHVLRAAAGEDLIVQPADLVGQCPHGVRVGGELLARGVEMGPEGRAHVVVSQAGRRFSKNAAIPSAASAPAKSAAEVRRRLGQALGPTTAGQAAQQRLGGAHRAGRRLAQRVGLGRHPGIEGGLVVHDNAEQSRARPLRRH